MPDTIISNIKQLLGLASDYTPFDQEIILHINSVILVLNQIGIGKTGFYLTLTDDGTGTLKSTQTWTDFLGDKIHDQEAVKSYIFMKVKLLFDPPASGTILESYKKLIEEFEFRLNVSTRSN